jgi:hypothetical protein
MKPFNFIDKLLEVTAIVESPTSYLEWAAYVTLASIMRHNVYYAVPSRRTKITPNLYVTLVGDSGSTRKSTPLKICNFLVKLVGNTKLVEGRASIQGVLKELAEVKSVTIENHKTKTTHRATIKHAAGLLYSEELAAFIVKDPSVTSILTDIYDYKDSHDIILKTQETMHLSKVCVTLFSATNAAFMQDMFTKEDIYGGLVGRTFFIIEEHARHKDLGLRDKTTEDDWDPLIDHLIALSKVEGIARLSDEALEWMEEWYNNTNFTLFESKTGYEHRAHTHALKLALIFAAAEPDFSLEVRLDHCKRAVDVVTGMRKNYHKIVATAGYSNNVTMQAIKDITVVLFQNGGKPIERDEILRRLFGRVDLESFDKAIMTLEHTGFIQVSGTKKPSYGLTKLGCESILGEIKSGGGKVN